MFIEGVPAEEARRICGFRSVAMLDYLQRSGVFVPTDRKGKRRGRNRRFCFRDLIVLRIIAELLKNGASVAALKTALQEWQAKKWQADEGSMQSETGEVLRYLVASGGNIIFAKSADTLFDLTNKGQMVFSFIVDLDELHSDVRFKLNQRELPGIRA